jgi:RNA ligase (TIGR02306 family)
MDRKLASIQTILSLTPIAGADRIVLAKILGWQCVVLKDEFKEGDKAVFFEIDSILPIAGWNDHLRKGSNINKPFRVRTIRLKNTLSQGLALPLSILSQCGTIEDDGQGNQYLNVTDNI